MEITWNNKQGARDRRAWLLLINSGRVHRFRGASIPGVVVVSHESYTKNGKWSNTTYDLVLGKGVNAISGKDGWGSGTFREGLESSLAKTIRNWSDLATCLGVSVYEAREFLKEFDPKDYEHFENIDEAMRSLEDSRPEPRSKFEHITWDETLESNADNEELEDIVQMAISFGSPTLKQMARGFWEGKVIITKSGEIVDELHAPSYESTTGKVRVIEVHKSSGHHGGYISVRIAAHEGSEMSHTFGSSAEK